MSSSSKLEDLPPETLLNIVDNLDHESALKFRKTSKGIRNVVDLRKDKFFCKELRETARLGNFCEKDLSELSKREALCVSRYNLCKDMNVKAYIKPGTKVATVPYGTTWVGWKTFKDIRPLLSHVILPETVEIVDRGAFFWIEHLQTFEAPNVKIISGSAFYGCNSLKRVEVSLVREIKEISFFNCRSLETFNAPMVKKVGKSAFAGCHSLRTVYVPRVKEIGKKAFDDCYMKEITISRDTKVEENAIPEGVDIIYWSPSSTVGIEGYTF